MFKKIIDYYKNNPEGYWFKRKLYGWGWMPVRWQGWLVVLGLVAVIILAAKSFLAEERVIEYFIALVGAVLVVIAIGYWKGEKPKWMWGLPKNESEEKEQQS